MEWRNAADAPVVSDTEYYTEAEQEVGAAIPSSGYGWLGGKERRSQFVSGVITMGQRVYVPQMGRFLQTDPIAGGSANDYDYVSQDPLSSLDLDGTAPRRSSGRHRPVHRISIGGAIDAVKGVGKAAAKLPGSAVKVTGRILKGVVNGAVRVLRGVVAWIKRVFVHADKLVGCAVYGYRFAMAVKGGGLYGTAAAAVAGCAYGWSQGVPHE